ncbi:MAG TPA: AAA family ATPase [Solirubrobacteraceae bacterium]|nr:AAA family ATPase [Solirubrobacteraceae bacterium]
MGNRAPGPGQGLALRGRANESALLDELVSAIRSGESRTLVLRGEAGIGKTALLGHLIESAPDMTVLRVVGVEPEMSLAYASLQQVCAPLLGYRFSVPGPQQRALEVVFGLGDGAAPDRFLVGLAVLSLFSEAADERPVLCVVDDAQWVDQESALTLAFVARRLLMEPVGIVFATREPGEELVHLPELEVGGLADDDARELVAAAVGQKLDEEIRDRFIAETHGNPLALLELPRGLTVTELAGGYGLVDARTLTPRIENSFVSRLHALPEDVRLLLLLAAADPVGDPRLLRRAAERLGVTLPPLDAPTEMDELLSIDGLVIFRHPLLRSAVYRSATPEDRRAVHLALAEATDPSADSDRRAWHLAAAADAPDEAVAAELERSASRAQARGGLAATAAFLERAVELTGDPGRRGERALAAATVSLQAGAFDDALGMLAAAEAGRLDEFQRVRVDLLRGHVVFASGLGTDAPPLLLKAARRLEAFDLELARETYLTAWGAVVFAGSGRGDILGEICRSVLALPAPPGAPRALDMLLDGLALMATEGRAAAVGALRMATRALIGLPVEDVLRWGWAATGASDAIWDDESTRLIAARNVQVVRDAGALVELPIHLAALGLAQSWTGDFAAASSLISEGESVAAAIGSPIAPYTLLRLRALQGSEAETSSLIACTIDRAGPGQALAKAWAQWAAAVLYNGLGRYGEAASAAAEAGANSCEPWVSMWSLPELVEAAVRVGTLGVAADALERLIETTQPSATDFALGIEARSRALLSHGSAADALYREAIERLSRTPLRPELARAQLLYGEWLRREQRRVHARGQLRRAHEEFVSIGMEAFAERARRELLATGEKVRKRTVETRDQLTAQERQIAQMARDGLSNAEIGARLFVSPRTVEWHLRKVFTKLGIHSRRELPGALPNSDPE